MSETLTSWLDLQPATKDTSGSNQKWDTVQPAGVSSKLNYFFNIQPFIISNNPGQQFFRQVAQLNFTAPQKFTILNWQQVFNQLKAIGIPNEATVFIKYRVGNVVTRYSLFTQTNSGLYYPKYNGQVILPNFCIELYRIQGPGLVLANPVSVITSISQDPVNVGDPNIEIHNLTNGWANVGILGAGDQLSFAVPMVFPWAINPNQCFLSN